MMQTTVAIVYARTCTDSPMTLYCQCEFGLDSLASCSLVELEKYSLSKGSSFGVDEMAQSLAVFPITTLNQPDVCNLVDLFVSKDFLLFARKVEEKSGSSSLINRSVDLELFSF